MTVSKNAAQRVLAVFLGFGKGEQIREIACFIEGKAIRSKWLPLSEELPEESEYSRRWQQAQG